MKTMLGFVTISNSFLHSQSPSLLVITHQNRRTPPLDTAAAISGFAIGVKSNAEIIMKHP